ncbi:Uncharacterised protein [Enterobacter cancerogenus]|uniref:Uncharacterized protein n=1 Tax=Enterobacter cancerogenus TaxID=69218 RepID=A0A484ZAF3_9ENTR|nr:Uncharacterised protein [Enterobacter cancerogenus]
MLSVWGDKFHLGHGKLLAEQRQQVQPVRLVFKAAHGLMQIALGAVFNFRRVLAKGFAQPAVDPGLVEEAFDFAIAPGKRKSRAVQNIVFNGGECGGGMLRNLAVERQG